MGGRQTARVVAGLFYTSARSRAEALLLRIIALSHAKRTHSGYRQGVEAVAAAEVVARW